MVSKVGLPTGLETLTQASPRIHPRRKQYGIELEVRKIAVLRNNGIGDFIFSLPALEALRQAYPGAEIVLLAQDWHANFLRGRPGPVYRVEVIPAMEGFDLLPGQQIDPEEVEAFFKRMQAESFDLAIQVHGGGRYSNPFVKRLGARITAGSRTPDAAPLDRWVPYAFFQMEILRHLEIVSLVGAKPVSLEPKIEVTARDLEEADALVPPSVDPLVMIHPSASDPRRRWPAENFASVGDALALAGAKVAVVGVKADRELVMSVVNKMNHAAINLCGRTTLGGLAGLFSRSDLVISNDSGPLHLASAVGAPGVGIYWVGNMITAGPVSYRHLRTAISWRMDCPVCSRNCVHDNCEHRDSFVADIPETDILASAFELLELNG